MTLREIENPTGVGALFTPDGRRVATVRYEIRVIREFQQARGQQLDDAENYVTGQVWASDPKDLSDLVGRALVLKLADGRAWECRIDADHQLWNTGRRGLRPAESGGIDRTELLAGLYAWRRMWRARGL